MIDMALLRDNQGEYTQKIQKKDPDFDVRRLCSLDQEVRLILVDVERLRQQKNELAQQAKGGVTDTLRQQSIEVGRDLKSAEERLAAAQQAFDELYLSCPNVPF